MIAQSETWTDVLTAVGTVGAVIVALLLAAAPGLRSRRLAPRLQVSTGLTEPFVRPIPGDRSIIAEVRLRVGVTNSGRSTAREVRAQLLNWWEHDPKRSLGSEWQERDSDPLPLKWVSIRPGDDRQGSPPEVNILAGATDYLDVALLDARSVMLLFDDNRQALFHRNTGTMIGTWRVQFAIGGSNCPIGRHTIEFSCDGKNYFSGAQITEPPTTSRHVGLFSLLRGGDGGEGSDSADGPTNPPHPV